MDKEAWKDLLLKALFAAVYGAIAELAATQSLNTDTMWVAVVSALLRGLAVFFATVKEEYDARNAPVPTAGMKKGVVLPPKKTIKRYL